MVKTLTDTVTLRHGAQLHNRIVQSPMQSYSDDHLESLTKLADIIKADGNKAILQIHPSFHLYIRLTDTREINANKAPILKLAIGL